jgi:hypothetical protein
MKILIAAAILSLGALGAAQALPVAPLSADESVTLVAQGCGPGMARNAAGHCRPAFIARPCPPGMHRNAIGRCRPNRY